MYSVCRPDLNYKLQAEINRNYILTLPLLSSIALFILKYWVAKKSVPIKKSTMLDTLYIEDKL